MLNLKILIESQSSLSLQSARLWPSHRDPVASGPASVIAWKRPERHHDSMIRVVSVHPGQLPPSPSPTSESRLN